MRIAGHNVIAIVLAAVIFWLIGAGWFGVLFSEQFIAGVGATDAELASADRSGWCSVGSYR